MIEISDEEYAEWARIAAIMRIIDDEADCDPFWFAREEGVEERIDRRRAS